jgi:hypothetical protein
MKMTIEITRQDGAYQYRISPTDPLLIERKPNTRGGRWYWYLRRETVAETKKALLNIGKGEQERK